MSEEDRKAWVKIWVWGIVFLVVYSALYGIGLAAQVNK